MKLIPVKYLAAWGIALILPFMLMLLVQIPLCVVKPLSNYVESLKAITVMGIISVTCALPSYIPFFMLLKTRKPFWINTVIFTLIIIPMIVPVWIFGFYTSRLMFSGCNA
jgi:hypothetical protein